MLMYKNEILVSTLIHQVVSSLVFPRKEHNDIYMLVWPMIAVPAVAFSVNAKRQSVDASPISSHAYCLKI